jgi:predicted outer membrane protein
VEGIMAENESIKLFCSKLEDDYDVVHNEKEELIKRLEASTMFATTLQKDLEEARKGTATSSLF